MDDGHPVRIEVERGIATITLDSPANRNALSAALRRGIVARLEAAVADDAVRAVVITGAGPAFCAGADLKEVAAALDSGGGVPFDADAPGIPAIIRAIQEAPKPVVAKLNGPARAGGLGIVAACDIALSPAEVTFSFTEVRIGVAPAMIAVACVPRMTSRALSRYLLTGETFSAAEAVEAGLLTATWPAGSFEAGVESVLDGLRKAEPTAVSHTKRLLAELPAMDRERAFAETERLSAELFASPQAAEGRASFREKRPPSWAL
jgi:enoyl-CoA hydratase/carnithine racemase